MNVITANDLKLRGVSILQKALHHDDEVSICVRGCEQLVVMHKEHYDYLRECEILSALVEAQEDVQAGRFFIESIDAHMQRLKS